jgi:hypothetical protein
MIKMSRKKAKSTAQINSTLKLLTLLKKRKENALRSNKSIKMTRWSIELRVPPLQYKKKKVKHPKMLTILQILLKVDRKTLLLKKLTIANPDVN